MAGENHHWVPKFLIKNFIDTDGRVFRLNIATNEVGKIAPKKAASSAGFYDFVYQGVSISFEDRLEKIETAAALVIRKIVNEHSLANLNSNERRHVADFIAAQSFRTQAYFKGLEPKISEWQNGDVFKTLWDSAFIISDEILRRSWALMVIQHDDVFYLGDNPVVLQRTENPSKSSQVGFDIEGVEAFLPLSSKCALYMPCAFTCQEIVSGYQNAISAPKLVEWANARGAKSPFKDENFLEIAKRTLISTTPLYRAFNDGVPLRADPENVENLNYLQCSWSYSDVYSCKGDFVFAKKLFSENPKYRDVIKVRHIEVF